MQQIKILIAFILTICTYFKYKQTMANKNGNNQQSKDKRMEEKKLQQIERDLAETDKKLLKIVENQAEKQRQHAQIPFQIDQGQIQRFLSLQATLFSKETIRTIDPKQSEIIRKSQDINDIFGGEYQKCKEGKIYKRDPKFPTYYSRSTPFYASQKQSTFPTNEYYFEQIKQAIQSEVVSINRSGMVDENPNPIHENNQQRKNGQNNVQAQNSQQQQPNRLKKKRVIKRKKIFKSPKNYLSNRPFKKILISNALNPKQNLAVPRKFPKKPKFKRLISLEKQIKKRQVQLAVLKKICQTKSDS